MLDFDNLNEIIKKYNLILSNYSWFFFNNLKVYKNQQFSDYLYNRGIIIIYNIFNVSLLYYDNLGDIYNICEKGYMYFVEFINQLNINVINNSNLELTIKDAIMFCYKKTIFLLENKICDTNTSNKYLHSIVNKYTIIINNLFIIVNDNIHDNFSKNNSNDNISFEKILKENILLITKLFKKIISLTNTINDEVIIYLNNIIEFQNIIINIKEKFHNNYENILCSMEKFISKKKYISKSLNYNEEILITKLDSYHNDIK